MKPKMFVIRLVCSLLLFAFAVILAAFTTVLLSGFGNAVGFAAGGLILAAGAVLILAVWGVIKS